jgi:Zn-dependent protease with chaperone function
VGVRSASPGTAAARARARAGARVHIARRVGIGVALAAAVSGWLVAAYFLWQTVVPDGLKLPDVEETSLFPTSTISQAQSYERFVRWDFVFAELVVIAVVAVYAKVGPKFVRESAAGPIGTGMLLAMLGLGLIWLLQLPFGLAELWWQRRHDVTDATYYEWIVGGWFGLGAEFLFVCLAILIVVGLAQAVGDWWWLPGGVAFVALATLFAFVLPYLIPGQEPLRRPALQASANSYERELGLDDIPIKVQDVSGETTLPNAEAVGMGPTRRVILWSTILRRPFTLEEQEVVVAHELGHHARRHILKGVGWYALFAIPGAFLISRITRRRGGMRNPEAVPLGLLALVVLSTIALPLQNVITRHMEAEADWVALSLTHDPQDAERLFKRFTFAAHADPSPPTWSYVLMETHPTGLQRIEMARAWRAREQPSP